MPPTPPPPAVAVVLTHRRRRLATAVVRNLVDVEGFAAPDVILVVNGEGGLDDPDLEARVSVVSLPDNLGPAGGFRAGLEAAARRPGVEWIYVCEDDVGLFGLPAPRVARLVAEAARVEHDRPGRPVGAVLAYGRDLDRRTGGTTVHQAAGDGLEDVDAGAWGASLVRASVVRAGVVPDGSWFFGYEDFDFWYRVSQAGFRVTVDTDSARHTAAAMTSSGRDRAFAGQRPVDADEPWRAYYVARNFFLLARRHGTWRWLAWHLVYSARRVQLAGSWAERAATGRGLWDGLWGRSGEHPGYRRTTAEYGPPPVPVVLHVLPNDVARGAQVFARRLLAALDGPSARHRLLTIFDAPAAVLDSHAALGVRSGPLRALDPRAVARLRRHLRQVAPAAVVAHGSEALKYLVAAGGHPRLVYYAIGVTVAAGRRGPRRWLYRGLLRGAAKVAAVSRETAEELVEELGVDPRRVWLAPNGRDASEFTPRDPEASPGADGGPPRLVFVGHLSPSKRPDRFVALVARLRREGCDVGAQLVGDGPLRAALAGPAAEAGVELLGQRSDVADLLAAADVFVFASVAEGEGMPGVLIEAALCGLPVVATDVPGATTVVKDGVTGFVVGIDDFEGMVQATRKLVQDPPLRAALGAAGRDHASSSFSMEASAASWRELIDSLVR